MLTRAEDAVSELLPSHQHAPRKRRSTPEIAWTVKTLQATVGRYTERYQCVTREKLVAVTEEHRLADEDSLRVAQYLMSETTLKAIVAGTKGEELATVPGTPQGDSLSPVLLAVYLE